MADPASAGAPEPTSRGRRLGLVAILAVAGAGLAAIAATVTWWSADFLDSLTGAVTITASGADCVPELLPLALVALAGFGAALATRGVPRRIVGAVILLCGAAAAVRSALAFGSIPAALVTELVRPADPVGNPQLHPIGPLLGLLAGLLLTAAGLLVLLGWGARQALGSRYERRAKSGQVAGDQSTDQGDWWKALDAGDDPTVADTGRSAEGQAVATSTADGPGETPPAVSEHTSGDRYDDPKTSRPT